MKSVPESAQQPQVESAIAIVAVALRVLKTRDKIDIGSDLIEERARNIVTALGSEFDLVPFAVGVERSTARLEELNGQLEALTRRGGAR